MSQPVETLEDIFNFYDSSHSGFIDLETFSRLCRDATQRDDDVTFQEIFRKLDTDQDQMISRQDFVDDFLKACNLVVGRGESMDESTGKVNDHNSVGESDGNKGETKNEGALREQQNGLRRSNKRVNLSTTWKNFLEELGAHFYLMSPESQQKVFDHYHRLLKVRELLHLVDTFEDAVRALINDIRQIHRENERFERCFAREKEQHARYVSSLEEDIAAQAEKLEKRIRKEEREKWEAEKEQMAKELEEEYNKLRQKVTEKEQAEMTPSPAASPSDEKRKHMWHMAAENRELRSKLTCAETTIAVLRSNMAEHQLTFQEKCYEMDMQHISLLNYVQLANHLRGQSRVLQKTNKQLKDVIHGLYKALGKCRQDSSRGKDENRQEYVAKFISAHENNYKTGNFSRSSSIVSVNSSVLIEKSRSLSARKDIIQESPELKGWSERVDLSLKEEIDVERKEKYRKQTSEDIEEEEGGGSSANRAGNDSECNENEESISAMSESTEMHQSTSYVTDKTDETCQSIPVVVGSPERIYKIIMAGDAAVGKSSFIMTLCKGTFVNNLSTTLGIDFHTKLLNIDGRVIGLQLWDTAGQERFRSLSMSYFRRADGVLLLYDCTYEPSFLHVRNWMDDIERSTQKRIPVMLVGNKTDLRKKMTGGDKSTFIKHDDGLRLAREYAAFFSESSALSGHNILETVTELARTLQAQEDKEMELIDKKINILRKGDPTKSSNSLCSAAPSSCKL